MFDPRFSSLLLMGGLVLGGCASELPVDDSAGPNNYATLDANRAQRGSGTYDQGGPRTTEFQLKVNF